MARSDRNITSSLNKWRRAESGRGCPPESFAAAQFFNAVKSCALEVDLYNLTMRCSMTVT